MTSNPTAWFDYQSGIQIPSPVTHLRVGFLQYQQILEDGNSTGSRTTTTIEVPHKVFQNHPNLQQVKIYLPAVSKIGNQAFTLCHRLEQVAFLMKPPGSGREEQEEENAPPSKLMSIGKYSFCRCQGLQSVIGLEDAKDSLQEIEEQAFDGCKSLINVNFLSYMTRLKSLGPKTFGENKMTLVDLSKAVHLTELPSYAFLFCSALTFVHLPHNLLSTGTQTFGHCSALEQIQLPDGFQTIGNAAFFGCRKLKSIVLPSSVRQIGRFCFGQCDGLGLVVLPSSRVPFLKTRPFGAACKSLSSLELPDSVPRHQWPLILEQFCQEDGIASECGEISDAKNRNTIVWNFLCQNMAQFFMEDSRGVMSRRRPVPLS